MAARPTLIDLPPAPSDPVTPSDMPGTPNSATTSMSELSTVAIKDGHRGHLPHASRNAPQPDAERADRISRLAGLERVVATARQPTPIASLTPGAAAAPPAAANSGYFEGATMARERSTIGSASATGSVGGRTTWASGSVDNMSDDGGMELDRSSVGGLSDDATTGSLVAFGEGARTPARGPAPLQQVPGVFTSPLANKGGRGESLTPTSSAAALQELRARDEGRQTADKIVKERIGNEGGLEGAGLGSFDFEAKK